VELIDDVRRDIASGKQKVDMRNAAWMKEIPGLAEIKLDSKLITTSSDLFHVESTATLHDAETTISAVLQRVQAPQTGKWTCRVVSWQVH
jgi:general secretion pathway protein K